MDSTTPYMVKIDREYDLNPPSVYPPVYADKYVLRWWLSDLGGYCRHAVCNLKDYILTTHIVATFFILTSVLRSFSHGDFDIPPSL